MKFSYFRAQTILRIVEIEAVLKAFMIRESFRPGLIGIFTNPFYLARKGLYQNIRAMTPYAHGRILDVGCGQRPYETMFDCSDYVGVELDSPATRINTKANFIYDGEVLPFANESFDTVVTTQVLEHVLTAGIFLKELNRILRENGGLLLSVPFVWDEHEQPTDYTRYSSFGLKAILEQNGFIIVEHAKSNSDIRVIFQLLNCYLQKQVDHWSPYCKLLACCAFCGPVNITAELFGILLPGNSDLYLDNVVFAKKKSSHA
jgi:SAM-dependent methyltransferase